MVRCRQLMPMVPVPVVLHYPAGNQRCQPAQCRDLDGATKIGQASPVGVVLTFTAEPLTVGITKQGIILAGQLQQCRYR